MENCLMLDFNGYGCVAEKVFEGIKFQSLDAVDAKDWTD